ncbi:unnamed protein product [Pieris brassicae]|uniref:Uncharacterized protein n=1 Tax=Pieris brassicae TaxID=7116 RepID=A0A9P0TK54_PIEBR|nr:unnamed protein product [Pieris brassicae]
MAVSVYFTVLVLNFFVKKINDTRIEEKYNVLYNKTANQYTQVNNTLNLNSLPKTGSFRSHKPSVNDLKITSNENYFSGKSSVDGATNSRVYSSTNFNTGQDCEKQENLINSQNGLHSWIINLINNNIINDVFTSKD